MTPSRVVPKPNKNEYYEGPTTNPERGNEKINAISGNVSNKQPAYIIPANSNHSSNTYNNNLNIQTQNMNISANKFVNSNQGTNNQSNINQQKFKSENFINKFINNK